MNMNMNRIQIQVLRAPAAIENEVKSGSMRGLFIPFPNPFHHKHKNIGYHSHKWPVS